MPNCSSSDVSTAASSGFQSSITSEADTNEYQTVIGIHHEGDPGPVQHFRAFQSKMEVVRKEAQALAAAALRRQDANDVEAATAEAGAREHLRRVAVDLHDVARELNQPRNRHQLEAFARAEQQQGMSPSQALAVPSGKPLSLFDAQALPAAFPEF